MAALIPDVVLLDIGLPDIDGFAVAERLAAVDAARPDVVLVSSRDRDAYGDRVEASPARGFIAKGDLDGPVLRAMVDGARAPMSATTRRRIVLAAIGLVALAFGPFATYQLTQTAPRSPALLLADIAVGWSMIAAGLILADRRPGNRIGPLAILTGFAWFVGDLTSAQNGLVAYAGQLAHGWFDPLFALVILAYPTGRIVRRPERLLAIGFIVVQAGWTIAKAYGMRQIGWWECPTCLSTVDAWIAAYNAMDPIGRIETLALTALSIGVLIVVVARWLRASGAARQRLAPVVLAGVVLAGGFVVTFLLQTVVPTSAREPLGELRVEILAILRVLVAVALLVGILRDEGARGRIADLVIGLDRLPPLPALQASLRDALGDPSLEVHRWEPSLAGLAAEADAGRRAILTIGDGPTPDLLIAHDPALRDDPGPRVSRRRGGSTRGRERAPPGRGPGTARVGARVAGADRRGPGRRAPTHRTRPPRRCSAATRLAAAVPPDASSRARHPTRIRRRSRSSTPRARRRPRRSATSASSPAASTPRSCRRPGSARRWRRWPTGRRSRCGSTIGSRGVCPRRSRRRPISSSPRP